ncbi:MAG: hypothetical protein RXR20_22010 [Paraburkholderia sp.]|uniref:hypothetical protein n=1 Tax=Paraburkholderia sp. TaxID=1926495 RepID=UPI0039798C5B
MLLVFIFRDAASGIWVELAALAAAATSAVLCAVGVACAGEPVLSSPPHAVSSNESAMAALLAIARCALTFDHFRLILQIVWQKPAGSSSCLFVCIIHLFLGGSPSRCAALDLCFAPGPMCRRESRAGYL